MSPSRTSFSFKGGNDPKCAVKNRYPEHIPRAVLCGTVVIKSMNLSLSSVADMARLYLKPKAGRPANFTYINAYHVDVRSLE